MPHRFAVAVLLSGCCPGPFCEGGPGMCGGLEGTYVLTTDNHKGVCGDIPASTPLRVTDRRPGYALEASWLSGCVLEAVSPGSCQYEARCEALVDAKPRAVVLRVTRNSSGFYGPAKIGACSLDVDTEAP